MNDRELFQFINGGLPDPFVICRLPSHLGFRIGSLSHQVLVHSRYAQKIRFKHRLEFGHFKLIPLCVHYGWAGVRGNTLVCLYSDLQVYGQIFKVAIKTTPSGHENWLMTFHRIRYGDVRPLIRKYRRVQMHYEDRENRDDP